MQNQVRFYITQSDDQAVVRAIPVQPCVVVEPVYSPEITDPQISSKPIDRLKVTKLVKSAVKLGGSGK